MFSDDDYAGKDRLSLSADQLGEDSINLRLFFVSPSEARFHHIEVFLPNGGSSPGQFAMSAT
jgi:hypothetical protein